MKKNYSKLFVAALVAASSFIGMQAQEAVVLQENFDKLDAMAGSVHKYGKNPWTGTDAEGVSYQPNYNGIINDDNVEDLNGWSSRTTYLYACQGYVRISKTNYGGDLLSPKFASLTTPTDVKLSWQGIGYTSNQKLNADGSYKSGLVHDYQYYCVALLGPGQFEGVTKTKEVAYRDAGGNDITLKAAVIEIPTNAFITMDTTAAWGFEGTKNELVIKGATAETQVAFMSVIPSFGTKTTDYTSDDMPAATDTEHGVNIKVNRVILDNIKVTTLTSTVVENIATSKEVKPRKVIENGQVLIIVGDKKYNVMGVELK